MQLSVEKVTILLEGVPPGVINQDHEQRRRWLAEAILSEPTDLHWLGEAIMAEWPTLYAKSDQMRWQCGLLWFPQGLPSGETTQTIRVEVSIP